MYFVIGFLLFFYVSYQVYQHFFCCDTGFGHGLAVELDKQGFHVLAGIYNPNNTDSLTKLLSSRATVFKLDITRQEDIDPAYELINTKTKTLHALVNNAGIGTGGYIDWITLESMRRVMDVNFFGYVAMTKKFLPLLVARRDSRVVNICSVAGYLTAPGMSAITIGESHISSTKVLIIYEVLRHT